MTDKILFLMALRNRRERALNSIKSVSKSAFSEHFDFLVVQDFDTDNLTDEDVSDLGVDVKIVNQKIGGIFYKTRLLNLGIALSTHKYIVQQDADILYSENFLQNVITICATEKNFEKNLFYAPYLESDDMQTPALNVLKPEIRKKGDYVADTFIFYRPQIETVHGFDERMRMWHEEEDIANRILRQFRLAPYNLGVLKISNTHVTHENSLRSHSAEESQKNLLIFRENNSRGINILEAQIMGNVLEHTFGNTKMFYRNNPGDKTVLEENFLKDAYSLSKLSLKKNMTVVDVGSHIGAFAINVADRVGQVICYEPDTSNFLLLKKNLLSNNISNVEVKNLAVTADGKEISIFINQEITVLNSSFANNQASFVQKFKSVALAQILQENSRIDILKIDCEGGEYDIFYNIAPEKLSKIGVILMEYHNLQNIDVRYTGQAIIEYLEQNNFRLVEEKADWGGEDLTGIAVLKNII